MTILLFYIHCLATLCHGQFSKSFWNTKYPQLGYTVKWNGFWDVLTTQVTEDYGRVKPTGGCAVCLKSCNSEGKILKSCGKIGAKQEKVILAPTSRAQVKELYASTFPSTNNIKTLEIHVTDLSSFDPDICKKLKKLETLKITRSKLKEMPDLRSCTVLKELDLYSNEIQVFRHNATKLPDSVETVILIKNNIYKMSDGYFDLPNLKYIALAKNQMRYFPGRTFGSKNTKLVYVGADNNHLQSLSEADLSVLAKIDAFKHLNVSNNRINYIAPRALSTLSTMLVLEIHNNSIPTNLREVFWNISSLYHLELHYNKLNFLPSAFIKDCNELKRITLQNQRDKMTAVYHDAMSETSNLIEISFGLNSLDHVPHGLFFEKDDWASLSILDLMNNQIVLLREFSILDFPPSSFVHYQNQKREFEPFRYLGSLSTLKVEDNQITDIGATDLKHLKNLQELLLDGNKLRESNIHEEAFSENRNLIHLSLKNNGIQYVPKALRTTGLSKLNKLYLDDNNIAFILTGTFSNLKELKTLSLSTNKILTIEDHAFPINLKLLSCNYNQVKFKSGNVFKGLIRLETIEFIENKIDVLPDTIFQGLDKLINIKMTSNVIGRLNKQLFKGLKNLVNIELNKNKIAYIEDGTFAPLRTKKMKIFLQGNQLSQIPLTDFWNINLNELLLSAIQLINNRKTKLSENKITKIRTNAFVNITCDKIDILQNRIGVIEAYAFDNVNCGQINVGGNVADKNPIREVESFAFFNVISKLKLDLSFMQTKIFRSNAFDIRAKGDLFLNQGPTEIIETNAINIGKSVNGILNLQENRINQIKRQIFVKGVEMKQLNLFGNEIDSISDEAFKDSKVTDTLRIERNKLTSFPAKAFSVWEDLKTITINRNFIKGFPPESLVSFSKLNKLEIFCNEIPLLPNKIFYNNLLLSEVEMHDNPISIIEDDAFLFSGTSNLKSFTMEANKCSEYRKKFTLDHLPKFKGNFPKLQIFKFRNVKTIASGAFDELTKLKTLGLYTNKLQCDCQLYYTLKTFYDRGNKAIGGTFCENKINIAKSSINGNRAKFICNPTDLVLSAPEDFMLRITYKIPTDFNAVAGSKFPSPPVFHSVCQMRDDDTEPLITGFSSTNTIDMKNTNFKPGRFYWCYMFLSYLSGGKNQTSPHTRKLFGSTKPRRENPTQCIKKDPYECKVNSTDLTDCDDEASNAMGGDCDVSGTCKKFCYKQCVKCNDTVEAIQTFDIIFYDFKAADSSIGKLIYQPDPCCPEFVPSPFGSWLKSDIDSDFKNYFHPVKDRNIEILGKQLILSNEGERDSGGNRIFRYLNTEYWQVNQEGFGTEGQKDSATGELINVGFTSIIHTGFRFRGGENFQFGGGESFYVYVDKIFVLHLVVSKGDEESDQIECKSFKLENITQESGYVIPMKGIVDKTKKVCINMNPIKGEAVNITLKTGVVYHLDIFHVEKFPHDSNFFMLVSGVSFANETEPVIDYVAFPMEDDNVNSIVSELSLSKQYGSSSTHKVSILSGNAEDRFIVKDDTTENRELAKIKDVKRVFKNITLKNKDYNEIIVLCDEDDSKESGGIKKTVTDVQIFDISTEIGLLVLKNFLDFESTQKYLLAMKVEDDIGNVGNIFVEIFVGDQSDNCPVFASRDFPLQHPLPPLQKLFKVFATDKDSGENGRVTYVLSSPLSLIPKVETREVDAGNGSIYLSNRTEYWTATLNLFAIDNGKPKHGDFFTVVVRYDDSCQEKGSVVVDPQSGQFSFSAPGMTTYNKTKFRHYIEQCYSCATGSYCPGNSSEIPCVDQPGESKHSYSFGGASKCLPCLEGFLCHDGMIRKCPQNTHVKCNATWCPKTCFPCSPGFHCYAGLKKMCPRGQYSDGNGPCRLCEPGTFSNTSQSAECQCCPQGYESTYMKDTCQLCFAGEFSNGCEMCKTCYPGSCACDIKRCYDNRKCHNVGSLGKSFKCGPCPHGFVEDGNTRCKKINECLDNPCYKEDACVQLEVGFQCRGCSVGYVGNTPRGVGREDALSRKQVCTDFNECQNPKDNICDINSECINLPGNYTCGKCNTGYVGDGFYGCRLADVCKAKRDNCNANATCVTLGSDRFHCKCNYGFAGDGVICEVDSDYDGIADNNTDCLLPACKKDNCKGVPNGGQEDVDGDQLGDVCDPDADNDYTDNEKDSCPYFVDYSGKVNVYNQEDRDNDTFGDICDNCPLVYNPDQKDANGNGEGDVCDTTGDIDGDTITDDEDNCKFVKNKVNLDTDGDGVGDICDNCLKEKNPLQVDANQNGFGDICDTSFDKDGDSIIDNYDNCIDLPNGEQTDTDNDGIGDVCDDDKDGDDVIDDEDNCMLVANRDQIHKDDFDVDARPLGTVCVGDFDQDGVPDEKDTCPLNNNIKETTFENYFEVNLGPKDTSLPFAKWRITNKGRDIEQTRETKRPSMLIGTQTYGGLNYSGVFYVNTKEGIDYFGIVFGYQSNRKFYVALWRHENINLNNTYKAAIKGIQIKLVNSKNAFTEDFADALWYSTDTFDESTLLWQDPKMIGWSHHTPYIFNIEFLPSLGRMRLQILQGSHVMTDSGFIYNTAITGGRLGVITYGQWNVIWSKLNALCLERLNRALYFGSPTSCIKTPTLQRLKIIDSFTLTLWIKLPNDELWKTEDFLPIICTHNKAICFFMSRGLLKASVGIYETTVTGDLLKAHAWYHIAMRYDGQGVFTDRDKPEKPGDINIYINGVSKSNTLSQYVEHDFSSNFFIGCDGNFKAFPNLTIDEIAIFNRYLTNDQILSFMKLAGLLWEKHTRIVTAHYNADQHQSNILYDDSEYENNANVTSITWIEGTLDKRRFQLAHVNNRARRHIHAEL